MGKQFTKLTTEVWDEELTPMQKMTYIALCKYKNNKTNTCYPSQQTLADKIGCSKKTIQRAIKALVDKKLINKTNRFLSPKQKTSNLYTILDKNVPTPRDIKSFKQNEVLTVCQSEIVVIFEDNICNLNNKFKKELDEMVKETSLEFVKELIVKQAEQGTYSFNGFKVAFNSYKSKKIETVLGLREDIKAFKSSKVKKATEEIKENLSMEKLEEKYGKIEVEKARAFISSKKNIKNFFAYLVKTLENGWHLTSKITKTLRFQNYDQRTDYDYDALEEDIVGVF